MKGLVISDPIRCVNCREWLWACMADCSGFVAVSRVKGKKSSADRITCSVAAFMLEPKFEEFREELEQELCHPVTVNVIDENKSLSRVSFENRKKLRMKRAS